VASAGRGLCAAVEVKPGMCARGIAAACTNPLSNKLKSSAVK